jgi:hypothetical protein
MCYAIQKMYNLDRIEVIVVYSQRIEPFFFIFETRIKLRIKKKKEKSNMSNEKIHKIMIL